MMKTEEIKLRLSRNNLSLFQFLIEGYERIATITTLDAHAAVVRISVLPDFQSDLKAILDALKTELDFEWILE